MKAYLFHVRPGRPLDEGSVMLQIEEGDRAPTFAECEYADVLMAAIAAGDPDIELCSWDRRWGVRLVFRKSDMLKQAGVGYE